jgi:PPOX class probable F420-dependent enzyme
LRLAERDCRLRVAAARVARLATADAAGQPHVVPMTFALSGDLIVSAIDQKPKSTTDLKRLRNIAANPLVAVLCDDYADDWNQLWWVRADGLATILADGNERDDALAILTARYPQYGTDPPRGPVIAIRITSWTGWSAAP